MIRSLGRRGKSSAELVVTCLSELFQSIPIMSEKQQRLVYSIIDFLNQSIQDGTVKADDQEGLEVASAFVVCILCLV